MADRAHCPVGPDARLREIGYGNESARRVFSVRKHLAANFDEAVAIAGVVDEDGHAHHVSQTATGSLQGLIEKREYGTNLRVKVPGDRLMVEVFGRGLTCQPNGFPALGYHSR